MMAGKHILMVSHYYPPHVGGIEIVAYNEAKRLARHGNRVTVVTSKTNGDPKSSFTDGVKVIRVPAFNGFEIKGVPFPIFSPFIFSTLWVEVRRADVIHIHDVFYISSFCAAFLAFLQGKRTVITQHVDIVPHPNKLVGLIELLAYQTYGRWTLRRCSQIITINTRVKDFLVKLGISAEKILEIPNGVDTELFRPPTKLERSAAKKTFGLSHKDFVVLFIGRYVPKKGYDLVRQAVSGEYITVFAGGDDKTFQSNKHQRNVGRLAQTELAKLYWTADLFVLPSVGEGFPLTAQEAMASGVPVALQYDKGYERYKLTPQHVEFLHNLDVTELKAVIRNLQRQIKRRQILASNAQTYAQKHFSWDAHIAGLEQLYATLQHGGSES